MKTWHGTRYKNSRMPSVNSMARIRRVSVLANKMTSISPSLWTDIVATELANGHSTKPYFTALEKVVMGDEGKTCEQG